MRVRFLLQMVESVLVVNSCSEGSLFVANGRISINQVSLMQIKTKKLLILVCLQQ